MASNKSKNDTITIYIRTKNEEEHPSVELSDKDKPTADPKKSGEGARNLKASNIAFAATVAGQGEAILMEEATYSFGKYASLTDDYAYDLAERNAKANIGVVASVAVNTLSMATIGAKAGGVPGAVIGAVIGTVAGGAQAYMKAKETLATQQTELNQQAYSLYYSTERAGLVNGSRYTEN